MRLIDAEEFIAETRALYNQAGWDIRDIHYSQSDVEMNLSMMPTIVPAKCGRWIWDDHGFYCSECLLHITDPERQLDILRGEFRYCSRCGTKMRGFDNENYD